MPKNRVRHLSDPINSADKTTIPLHDIRGYDQILLSTHEYQLLLKRCRNRLLSAIRREAIEVETIGGSVDGPVSYIVRIDDFASSAIDHFAAHCGCALNRNFVRRQLPSLQWLLSFNRVKGVDRQIFGQISDHLYHEVFAGLLDQGFLLYDEDEYTLYVDSELIEQTQSTRTALQPTS